MSDGPPDHTDGSHRTGAVRSYPRLFFVGMGVLLFTVTVAGFWPSYFGPLLRGEQMTMRLPSMIRPSVIHSHAALFMGWLAVFLGQTVLIARKKTRIHTKVGLYGLTLGSIVVAVALLVVGLRTNILVAETGLTVVETPAINLGIVLQPIIFAVLLGLVYRNRRQPVAHKRYMLLATMSIMPAATDRIDYLLGPYSMQIMTVLFVAIVLTYDYRRLGRPHKASLAGTALLLTNMVVFTLPFTHGG